MKYINALTGKKLKKQWKRKDDYVVFYKAKKIVLNPKYPPYIVIK